MKRPPSLHSNRFATSHSGAPPPRGIGFSLGRVFPGSMIGNAPPTAMNADLLWFVRFGIEQGLFTRAEAVRVKMRLGGEPGMLEFAQKLIDDEIVSNVEALEKLAGKASLQGQQGAPSKDPFMAAEDTVEEIVPRAPKKAVAGPAPVFPFETVGQMDEKALASGMRRLLEASVSYGASDLHLSTGRRPFVRKDRALSFISERPLGPEEALRLNTVLLSAVQNSAFLAKRDLDYALAVGPSERYRVNLMFHKEGAAGSYRMVPNDVKTMPELGFSEHLDTLKRLLSYHNGLVLITGPAGSGKTTTLASMVAYLNETRKDHIITVEDPIEVVQPGKGCNVTQRQVGEHTRSFFTALKGALREDPDIIVIGELRDLETIEMAVTAAETGHLVIGTMHTSDAATTLNRLLDVFPSSQQSQIRASVAESLRGIVCQRLLPPAKGSGLVMACEILVNNMAISNLVREGKTTGLRNTMETGVREGMCLMDSVVFSLWKDGKVSKETALANVSNRALRVKIV
jgi:twitching motility protein PilT